MYKTIKYNEIIWNMRTHEKQYQKKKKVKKEMFMEKTVIGLGDTQNGLIASWVFFALKDPKTLDWSL